MEHSQQPTEDLQASQDRIRALYAQLTGDQSAMAGQFNGALGAVNDMQPPAPMSVPGRVSPLGGMASIFAATLADQMGARGSMQAAQQNIEQKNAASDAAAHENYARAAAFDTNKQLQRLGIQLKFAEAKAEALAKGTDHEAYLQQLGLVDKYSKEAKRLQEEADVKAAEQQHKYRMEEIIAGKTASGEDKAAAAQAKEDESIRKFQEDISNIAKKPGASTPAEKANWLTLSFKDKVAQLSPAGIAQIRGRSTVMAKSAGSDNLRRAALQTYAETLRGPDGTINIKSPEWIIFSKLVNNVLPKPSDQVDLATSLGIGQ